MKKYIKILMLFFIIFCIFSTAEVLAAGSINFNYKRKAININEILDINAILTSSAGGRISWSSSDTTVAAVSRDGVVSR